MNDNLYIRRQIRRILSEQDKKGKDKKGKEIRSRAGRGRWKFAVKEAGALATQNPGELMSRLGIGGASGKTTEKKVYSIIQSAISGNDVMSRAYGGAELIEDNNGNVTIEIAAGEIGARDGTKYMEHTLIGAKNAGLVNIDKDVDITNAGGSILVEFS